MGSEIKKMNKIKINFLKKSKLIFVKDNKEARIEKIKIKKNPLSS